MRREFTRPSSAAGQESSVRIFYWHGGTINGEWREAFANVWPEYTPAPELIEQIKRAGFTVRIEN